MSREDQALPFELFFVGSLLEGRRIDLARNGQFFEHRPESAHIHHLLELIAKIGHIETAPLLDLFGEFLGLFLVDLALDFLDQVRGISKVSWMGLVRSAGCNSEKYRVSTRNLEFELAGARNPRNAIMRNAVWAQGLSNKSRK